MSVELAVNDAVISAVAREVARDIYPLDMIRERYKLNHDDFDRIVSTQMFQQRLAEEVDIWNASDAKSVVGRIQAKAATMIEDALIEASVLIHDKAQPMSAKVEMLKWASRMAGVDANPSAKATNQEKLVININIGDQKLSYEKQLLPPQVIEGDATTVVLTPDSA